MGPSKSGSVASSVYGEVRTTLDVDLVVELRPQHVDDLIADLEQALERL